jgi:hypothetical protein
VEDGQRPRGHGFIEIDSVELHHPVLEERHRWGPPGEPLGEGLLPENLAHDEAAIHERGGKDIAHRPWDPRRSLVALDRDAGLLDLGRRRPRHAGDGQLVDEERGFEDRFASAIDRDGVGLVVEVEPPALAALLPLRLEPVESLAVVFDPEQLREVAKDVALALARGR